MAACAAAVLALAAVAYAATRPPEPAHRAAPLTPAASKLADSAVVALARAKASVTPAKPIRVAPKPAAIATPTASAKPATKPKPRQAPFEFDSGRAMGHVRTLSVDIGKRVGGTEGEWRAVVYARDYLRSLGYDVTVTDVKLHNGRTSHNVIARKPGASGPIVVLGGHIDSKGTAPGADDNATGVGTVLELARDFSKAGPNADVRFVAFGTEETIGDGDSNHHHYGSRAFVASLTDRERSRFAAMISVDMIGYGSDFRVRTMGVGTRLVADRLLRTASRLGLPLEYLRDPGSTGWSDHEPFEKAGLPAAWVEWRDNPNAHTSGDTYGRLDEAKVRKTGQLVHAWLRSLTDAELTVLVRE